MPASFRIDHDSGLVYSTLEGVVTDRELIDHQQSLFADPGFDPSLSQLADCTGITRVEVSTKTIHAVAVPTLFAKGTRLAIVAKSDVVFGMARMFQMLREGIAEEVKVFRDIAEAKRWLKERGPAPSE